MEDANSILCSGYGKARPLITDVYKTYDMSNLMFEKTLIEGAYILRPKIIGDHRGYLYESFNQKQFMGLTGLQINFVQDNHSFSHRAVLRGLHYQYKKPQGKLIRVSRGEIYDVIVDLRENSKTYGNWFGMELSALNQKQLWAPPGVAHGFLVLSDGADVLYKMTEYYDPQGEVCLDWNDPTVGIEWPLPVGVTPNINAKDAAGLSWDAIPKF